MDAVDVGVSHVDADGSQCEAVLLPGSVDDDGGLDAADGRGKVAAGRGVPGRRVGRLRVWRHGAGQRRRSVVICKQTEESEERPAAPTTAGVEPTSWDHQRQRIGRRRLDDLGERPGAAVRRVFVCISRQQAVARAAGRQVADGPRRGRRVAARRRLGLCAAVPSFAAVSRASCCKESAIFIMNEADSQLSDGQRMRNTAATLTAF